MELQKVIDNRKSVRKFTDYYVSDKEIKEILQAGLRAPSWANTQVWEFIVVREREIIKEIVETYSETNPARKCSLASSALIVICAKIGISGYKQGKQSTKFNEWFMFDMGMCVQNMFLKAYDLGLGTVVVGYMDHDKCNELLHVPEEVDVVAVLPVGKPYDPEKKGPPHKELKECVYLDRFGEKFAGIY